MIRWAAADTWYPIAYWPLPLPAGHREIRFVRHTHGVEDKPMRGSFLLTGPTTVGFTVARNSARPVRAAIPGFWVLPDQAMGSDTAFDKRTSSYYEADQLSDAVLILAAILNDGFDQADIAVLDHVLAGTVNLVHRDDRPGADPETQVDLPSWPTAFMRPSTTQMHRLVDELRLLTLGGVGGDPTRPYRLTHAGAALRAFAHRGDDPTPEEPS